MEQPNKFLKFLLTDDNKGNSASKFWFTIFNLATLVIYVKVGISVANSPDPNLEGLAWLVLVVSGVITTNKFATMLVKNKYAASVTDPNINYSDPRYDRRYTNRRHYNDNPTNEGYD